VPAGSNVLGFLLYKTGSNPQATIESGALVRPQLLEAARDHSIWYLLSWGQETRVDEIRTGMEASGYVLAEELAPIPGVGALRFVRARG
jgi:hypothetical protein